MISKSQTKRIAAQKADKMKPEPVLPAPPKIVGGYSIEFFNTDGSLSIRQDKELAELGQAFEAISRLFAAQNGFTYSVREN